MKTTRMHTLLILLFFIPVICAAGSLSSTAQDEVEYAKRLAEVGYTEFARMQLENIESDYKPVIQGYIQLQKADRQDQPKKQAKTIGKALEHIKSFVENHPNHPRITEARFTYAETLRKAGKAWTEVVKQAGDDLRASAVENGKTYFDAARDVYRNITNTVEESLEKGRATYFKNVTFYEMSRLHKAADQTEKVKELLKKMVEGVDEFLWTEWGSGPPGKRLSLYAAVSYYELHRIYEKQGEKEKVETNRRNAEHYFSSVIGNMDKLQQEKVKLDRQRFRIWTDLVLRGYYFWTRVLNDTDQYEQALNKSGEALSEFSKTNNILTRVSGDAIEPLNYPPGKALLLERARAFFRTAQKQKAIELANRVANRGGGWGQTAKKLVSRWAKMVGRTISVETWLNMVDGALQREKHYEALQNARNGLGAISSEEERIRWKWKLYDRLALIYTKLERWYEAGLVYEQLHDEFHEVMDLPETRSEDSTDDLPKIENILRNESAPNDQSAFIALRSMIPRANYQAAKSIGFARRKTGFKQDETKFQSLLSHLSKEHPETRWADKTNLLLGDLFRQNEQFDQAIAKYNETKKGGTVWEESQIKVGYTYYLKGKALQKNEKTEKAKQAFQQAIETYRQYLSYARNNPASDAADRRSRVWDALDVMAFTYLQDAYNQPKKVLDLLTEETLNEYDFSTDVHTSALYHRMNAYLKMGKLNEAGNVADRMYETYPGSRDTIDALGDLATRYDDMRRKEGKTQDVDVEKLNEHWKNACYYYYRWIDLKLRKQDSVSRDTVFSVAMILKDFGARTGNEKYLNRAGELLQTLLEGRFKGQNVSLTSGARTPSEDELQQELASVYVNLGRHEKAVQIYDRLLQPYENEDRLPPGWLLMGQAELYIKLYEKHKKENNAKKASTYLKKAQDVLYQMYENTEEQSDPWWKIRYYLLKLDIMERNVQSARNSIKILRQYGEKPFAGRKAMFQDLVNKLNEITPGK